MLWPVRVWDGEACRSWFIACPLWFAFKNLKWLQAKSGSKAPRSSKVFRNQVEVTRETIACLKCGSFFFFLGVTDSWWFHFLRIPNPSEESKLHRVRLNMTYSSRTGKYSRQSLWWPVQGMLFTRLHRLSSCIWYTFLKSWTNRIEFEDS